MVGTDGEGMEETDGGVLHLVAVRCCLLVACQHCRASLSHLLAMLLSSRVVVLVPCCCRWLIVVPSYVSTRWVGGKVGWGLLTYHQQRQTTDVVRRSGCHVAVGDVAPAFPASRGQLFPSVGGCFHICAVVRVCSWLFSYICIHGQSFTFVADHLHS